MFHSQSCRVTDRVQYNIWHIYALNALESLIFECASDVFYALLPVVSFCVFSFLPFLLRERKMPVKSNKQKSHHIEVYWRSNVHWTNTYRCMKFTNRSWCMVPSTVACAFDMRTFYTQQKKLRTSHASIGFRIRSYATMKEASLHQPKRRQQIETKWIKTFPSYFRVSIVIFCVNRCHVD